MKFPFKQVDVFTAKPFKGNPLAVTFDAEDLDDEQLQSIARWTNLSETIFILKPTTTEADYRVRIFTKNDEMNFAGHPTVGAFHAFREKYQITKTKLVQECKAGLVQVEINDQNEIFFQLPGVEELEISEESLNTVLGSVGINESDLLVNKPRLLNVGPKWVIIQLESVEKLLSLKPNVPDLLSISEKLSIAGCSIFAKISDLNFEMRTFSPISGFDDEDPACGSGAGAVGAFLAKSVGLNGAFLLNQGRTIKRDSKLQVNVESGNKIKVGGHAVTVIDGTIDI